MKTIIFTFTIVVALMWFIWRLRLKPSREIRSIDAIVPAYNEELCIAETIRGLLLNRYIMNVIVVNDGSTDGTGKIIDAFAAKCDRVIAVHQENTGKGGALMAGVAKAQSPHVLLTDADTIVPPDDDGLGFLLAEIERGADAVGGIPASNLDGAGLLPHIRATVKLPMIAVKRTFQQLLGGAPFLISGACGLFRTEVLKTVPFSDRTKVEDLDMTWSLVAKGYKVRQSTRCIVYSQECNSLKSEWLRWRRWIIGYSVCMRLHRSLLLSRFGLFSILPMFLVVVLGIGTYLALAISVATAEHPEQLHLAFLPLAWLLVSAVISLVSAMHYRRASLLLLAPTAIVYVLLAYSIWIVHGLKGLVTGKEPQRDKPQRYAHVVA